MLLTRPRSQSFGLPQQVTRDEGEEENRSHHARCWPACEEEQDQEDERMVVFADQAPRHEHKHGWDGLDSKIGELDRRMSRLALTPSPSPAPCAPLVACTATGPLYHLQLTSCSTGEGEESGEERRPSPSSFTVVLDVTSTSISTPSARFEEEQNRATAQDQDQDVEAQPTTRPNALGFDNEDEDEDEDEENEEEEDDEEAELVEVEEDDAERAEEVAEELAAFDAATERLLRHLEGLRDRDGAEGRLRYLYKRSRVVAVADSVRTVKQRVEEFADPLAYYCPAHADQLRLAVRSLSNAVVQLLNGLQAGTHTFVTRKMEEVRNLLTALRSLLVEFLLEACAEAEANQDLIRQAAYLKEAAQLGTETAKVLQRAWEEMIDTSVLASNIKLMIRLCVLAADKDHGMRDSMAKRLKRRCLRLGKACETLMRGVRQGVEVDDQFEKLVLALSEWRAALAKAHQDLSRTR